MQVNTILTIHKIKILHKKKLFLMLSVCPQVCVYCEYNHSLIFAGLLMEWYWEILSYFFLNPALMTGATASLQ